MFLSIRVFSFISLLFFCVFPAFADSREELLAKLNKFLAEKYGSVEASSFSTGIFYDSVLPLSHSEFLSGVEESDTITLSRFIQTAHELKRAALNTSSLPRHEQFREWGREAARDNLIPLSILDFRVNKVSNSAVKDSVIQMQGDEMVSIDESAMIESEIFAFSPLYPQTFRGEKTRFQMDLSKFFFTNQPKPAYSFSVDFDDGLGWRTVSSSREFEINYRTVGTKTLRLRAVDRNGRTRFAKARFNVRTLDTPAPTQTWTLQSDLQYNGQYSTGQAYVLLADEHTQVTRPVIVSEGFDLDNSMFWDELYNLLNQENLIETLRAMGYDAVVLNYTDATKHLQSNAYLVESLIDTVEQIIDPSQTICLVGASMGGLTTRYALTRMEANSVSHRVRTLLTFDAPHKGANIPLGIQYWVNFFAGESADAEFLLAALNSPASRQMLVTHFTTPASSTPSADAMRSAYLADLQSLGGYPSQPRLVAVSNGSANQIGMSFAAGAQIVRYEYGSFLVDVTGNIWAVNHLSSQLIFQGEIDLIWPFPDTRQNVTVLATPRWDNAPGGTRATMAQMDSVEVPYGDLIALHQQHCFIPTVSALDLNVSDPFFNVSGANNLYSLTSFDSLYFPAQNQEHVEVTPENFWWLIEEIADSLKSPQVLIQPTETNSVRFDWTKVAGARSYHVYSSNNSESWSAAYTSVSDTFWSDAVNTDSLKFYRVEASSRP